MNPLALGRRDSWDGVRAVVAGLGPSGFAAADNLTHLGARVIALDESPTDIGSEKATLLEILGADVRLGAGSAATLPDGVDVVIVSPEQPPSALLAQAVGRGIPIWGEVELAWRLRDPEDAAPWLAVTGASGITSTVRMLEAMLGAGGLRAVACGSVGLPIVEVVMAEHGSGVEPYDVLAVGLSGYQLHHTDSMRARSAVVLDVAAAADAEDHGRIYRGVECACIYNVADARTEQLVRDADVAEGARAVGFTLGIPSVGMLGLVDDVLCDRAFIEERQTTAAELCTIGDLASPAAPFIANALAAAALARSHGVPLTAVREALIGFRP